MRGCGRQDRPGSGEHSEGDCMFRYRFRPCRKHCVHGGGPEKPRLQIIGGCAIKKMLRSHRVRRRRGGWFQKQLFWSLNEPPRPRLSLEREFSLMARPPLLCQGVESAPPKENSTLTRGARFWRRSAAEHLDSSDFIYEAPLISKDVPGRSFAPGSPAPRFGKRGRISERAWAAQSCSTALMSAGHRE